MIKAESRPVGIRVVPKWISLAPAVFLLTSLVGVWAAYDRDAAWAKVWLIAAGILLFYALSSLSAAELWVVIGGVALVGDLISIFFLLASDGSEPAVIVRSLTQAGLGKTSFIPVIVAPPPDHDIVGGLLAMLMPFIFLLGWFAWKTGRRIVFALALLSGALCLFCLIVTNALAAWLALVTGLGIWLLWEACRHLGYRMHFRGLFLFGAIILVGGLAASALLVSLLGKLPNVSMSSPVAATMTSRVELYQNSFELVPDFLFTGGGLAGFPGLYSQYILGIPYFMYGYSHNLYLDLVLEQGLPGLLVFSGLLVGCIWLLMGSFERVTPGDRQTNQLIWATLAALIVLLVNGLGDDPLYGQSGTSLMFLVPGMAVAVAGSLPGSSHVPGPSAAHLRSFSSRAWIFLLTGAIFLVLAAIFYRPVISAWYANLGAVEMARVELAGWPTGAWESSSVATRLEPAEERLVRSLSFDPTNVAARYRLGMIAMLQRRYDLALTHLEAAYRSAPNHRGVRKQLGFSTLWSGQIDEGLQLLGQIPGLKGELDAYAWWWHTQGRDDLAAIAQESSARLHIAGGSAQP